MATDIENSGLLPLIKMNNLMELLPKILHSNKDDFKITPSEFMKQMNLTTEERHKLLVYNSNMKPPLDDECPSQIRIVPNILVFQRCEARSTNVVNLVVKNIGKNLLPLKMFCPSSIYFSAAPTATPMHKLAPGLSVEYKITFTPKEVKDYSHHIAFKCKEETFCVPIIALGPRAILDIPDQIILNPAPVKLGISKCIAVRNIGDIPASFNFITESPFKVNPAKGFLSVHDSMIVTVSFESFNIGEVTGKLFLVLETGEKLTINLRGTAENVSVRLEKSSLVHEDTFLGLMRCKSVRLCNNSSNVIKYCWKKRATMEEDFKILESLKPKYADMAKFILHRDTHLKYFELCNSEGHKLSCERILQDELNLLEKEEFKFSHEAFTITPEKGEIWPKASVEFVVSFAPKCCGAISTEAYLEVTGRDIRIPFQIRGYCLGPKIVLTPQTLDTDYIYLCSHHKYEVIAVNKGDIPGTIKYKMESSIFGGKIDVEPESRVLNPGECGVFIVSFTSNKQGEFIEQLSFRILESEEIVSFILTGKIVSPTLHFDRRSIDFGTIPFGFPTVRDVTLNNLSVVPVTFSLKVMSDGQTPSISYKRFASVAAKPRLPVSPKEFQIDPQESVVEPFSSKKVMLTLTANKMGKFFTSLEMDMWDAGSGSVSCPIRYHSVIPNITSEPESINIPFCFINFPYTRSIILKNNSKVAGFFYIVPPDPHENNTMTCSASTPQGVIEPTSSLKIDITLITSALGRQYLPINLLVYGYEVWKEVCTISCVGQGPVVTVSSYNLHWGETPLLEGFHKTLTVSNESPIPASGRASLTRINSPWSVDVCDFTLAPSEKISIIVSLFLRDRGKFKDTLKLYIHNGKVLSISLSANGVGSSLNIQPKIYPTFDLDTLFSHKNYEIEILIENKGSKPYGLVWSPFPDYTHFVSMKLINPPNMIFKFEPTKMDLLPGEIKTLNLIVRSTNTGYFTHTFYCFASIGVPTKELHFTTDVFATFVEPLVVFDKCELRYWCNIGYDGTDRKLEDAVKISNVSVLPLHVYLTVRHPFRILSPFNENLQNYEILLKGNTSENITIRFLPEIKPDSVSRIYSGVLNISFQEHSKKFNLALNGEVNYPTLLIMPRTINFDFVPIAMNVYKEIILVNVSPLTVYFHITWNALTSELVDIGKKVKTITEDDRDLKESVQDDVESDKSDRSSKEKIRKSVTDSNRRLNACEIGLDLPLPKMPKIEISRAEIKKAIFPFAKKYYECEEELMNAYRMARSSDLECTECVPEYGKVCDITPMFGKLEKYSSQILSVSFCSETAVKLHLEAMINIKSGPTEIITIDGAASDVRFYLETRELDFGKQLFCKPASRSLKIENIGDMPFTYEVVLKMEHGITDPPIPSEKGLLTVTPHIGTVNSFSCFELTVSYLPRIPGRFDLMFKLHIAYLDPVIITVKGYGVFPQVHLALPRTEMMLIPSEVGYMATADITSDWFPNEYQAPDQYNISYIKPYRSQESNLDNILDYEEPNVLVGDWEFIKHNESMPTDIDIQLAIERILAINLMSKNSENQTLFSVYARSIPQFIVPAYETNFGNVIIGRCVEHTLTVTNYGPLPVIFYSRFGPHMKESGISVRLKNRNELAIGVSLPFVVSFTPKKNKYRKQLEVVDEFFYFEIYHGPKIPIKVFATVTYPYVIASSAVLNFSDIICGNCKAINLRLKNPGLVPAQWTLAFLSNPSKVLHDDFKDGRFMFHLNYKSGFLNPEEYCTVQISFKPDYEGRFVATLWVQVYDSLEELKVVLIGEGIEPKLNISDNVLTFGPTPPYPHKLDKYFTVENPCPFPIEFYFPTFDEQIYEEEKIIRAVCTYYQSQEILLPVRKPGEGLPIELVNFYQILLEDLNAKYMEEERGKVTEILDESMSAVLSSEDNPLGSPSQISFAEKKKKMKRSVTRTRTGMESTRTFNIDSDSKKEESVHSIFQKKTSSEIENMLQTHIKELLNTNPEYDPIQAALKPTILPSKEEEYKEGLLVIFHGAPYTNSIQLANRAALASGYQAISVDRIILEEATYGRCEAGLTARELIQEAYWDHIEVKTDHNFQHIDLDESNDHSPDFASAFEEIEREFDALKTMRENLIASKGKQGTKSSSAKSESAKAKDKPGTPFLKPMNINAPLANITEELVIEILKFRVPLEVSKGMVLESLQSVFVTSCTKVLTSVLKCAGNIRDILVVLMLSSYVQYNRCLYAAQIEQGIAKNIKMMLRERMLTLLEEENEDKILECLNLEVAEENEEFSKLREFFLQQRHLSYDLYTKKKKEFYEILRLLNITGKVPDGIRFKETAPPVEKKKEGAKSVKQSEGGRVGSEDKAGKGKKDPIEMEFVAFESELAEIRATVENWDQRIGATITDMAVDAKSKKGQTPRKPTEVNPQSSLVKANPGRGVHVWLVDLSRPEKDSFAGVSCHLRTVLQNRYIPSESDNWPLTTTESMIFSVVSYPPIRNKPPISDVYRLTYSEPVIFPEEENGEADELHELPNAINIKLNRSTSQISFKGKRRGCMSAKRRREESRMSTEGKGIKKINSKPLTGITENFKSRWILQPMEALTWKVRYFPVEPGEIREEYPLNVINWQSNTSILCVGICDIPALDMTPEIFYPAVAVASPVFNPIAAYLYSDDIYDFGSITYVQQSGFRNPERNANFHLLNKSSLPVDLTVLSSVEPISDDGTGPAPYLRFEPEKIYLESGESSNLHVTVCPNKYGEVREVLMLLVKNNPKVESVKVKFEGVKANVTVDPKSVNFERVLLRRKDHREVIFTNNNDTPLYINLVDVEKVPTQIAFSSTCGWIQPLNTLKIDVEFSADQVLQLVDLPIQVQVFDDPGGDSVQDFVLTVTAEAYDVALDIIFSDKDTNHIDFGTIRMRMDCLCTFNLKNVGKYPLTFKVILDQNFLDQYENDHFSVSPNEGVLQPGKLFPVIATIHTSTELLWQRVQLLKILLIEPNNADELVAKIPIDVSVKTHFPSYTITPYSEFNFGHVRVASVTTGLIRLENKGQFPLSYLMESLAPPPPKPEETNKKGSKPSVSSKEKDDKGKKGGTNLNVGPFEITPTSGIVDVGQAATITVTGRPGLVDSFEEKIGLSVNESPSLLVEKNEIFIRAIACLPSIDFDNYKTIFREHFIAKNEADFTCPTKFESYTLFTEKNLQFSFKNVCLYKAIEARIYLPNSGLIECRVRAKITSLTEEGTRGDTSKNPICFSVNPAELIIEPYTSGTLTVTFRPEAIEDYRGWLHLNLEMPDKYDDTNVKLALSGNGVLPQIEILEPQTKLPEGPTLVNFVPTAPQRYSTSTISFTNLGPLACKVIMELYNNREKIFTLIPKEKTEKMLQVWETAKPIDHTVIVSTFPGETAEFTVMFSPKEVKTYSSQIKLFPVDNPFENHCYKLTGDGYFEEVTIEKIRISVPFLGEDCKECDPFPVYTTPGQFALNLNDCYVKKETKALLRLLNKTQKDYFRFVWEDAANFTISPSVGHLYPNTYKEILIKFKPQEPMELDEVPLICSLDRIVFEYPPDSPAWDSRLVQPKSLKKPPQTPVPATSSRRESAFKQSPEPPRGNEEEPLCDIVPETTRMLFVNVSGTADYARLYCDPANIIFKNTFMFQTRIYPFVLQNTGNVVLEYRLSLSSVTTWPLKQGKMTQVREQSFIEYEKPVPARPQSWVNSSSDGSSASGSRSGNRCRPRPLTSGSLLDLTQTTSNPPAEEPALIPEEQKVVAYNPFLLENPSGQISAREKVTCNIIFSPMDVNEFRATLTIQVPNLHPECKLPQIKLTASSLMPYCHFNIPESDYLESGRRDCSRPGPIGSAPGLPLSPDTKTIEIKVLGVGQTVPIKFHVINPTEEDYTFSWVNITQTQPEIVQSFHCSTLDGHIQAGRQQQMLFNFVSQRIGVAESFWKFYIPEYNVETQFLFVGDVREPSIYFLSSHVNMKPTFIGASSTETLTLVNHENVDFEFRFLPDSLYSEGRMHSLNVEPTSGRILANSETDIRITFFGKTGGKVLFFLKCKIKSVREAFTIAVEATTYVVQPLVMYEDLMKIKHQVESDRENLIDFGAELTPLHPKMVTFFFTSISKTSFYYDWIYDKHVLEAKYCKLKFSTKNGHMASFSKGKCDLTILFSKKSCLTNYPVKLKIRRGPTYNFIINASASTPTVGFSCTNVDFGYCFLQERDICYYEIPLLIRNKDTSSIVLEASLPESSAFSFLMPQAAVFPKEEVEVVLRFHPKEKISYSDTLKFVINGLHEKFITLKGQGTEFKVTLENAENSTISMGAVKAGKSCTRDFYLVNKSLAPANLLIGFSDQLPVCGSYLAKPGKNKLNLTDRHRLTEILTLHPSQVFTIQPKQVHLLSITYTPSLVCSNFSETVCLQFQDRAEPLCMVTACCIGPDISLDRTFLNFGAVVQDCSSVMKVKILNSGSIGTKFQWLTQMLGKEYSIYPSTGYCSPESDVTIQITFRPTEIMNSIKSTIECSLNLSENEKYPSLFLTMTGSCVAVPEPIGTVSFECFVRSTDTKTIEIENWSGSEWQLFPVFSGEHFKGGDAIVIPALTSANYEINYCPLLMTPVGAFHYGSVFFRLPNGQGLLYNLTGTSLPPSPEEIITREIPCKTKYVELLKIKNWLQYTQRLKIEINCVSGAGSDDPVWSCTGLQNLDLPSLSEKEYYLNFFAYKPGNLKFKVSFINEETSEYKWFDLTFKIVMCGPLEVITLKCGVRQTCHREIKLENPLGKAVQYKLSVPNPEISFDNNTYSVQPGETVYAKLMFTPIHAREKMEELIVECPELGIFPRELRLVAVTVPPEPPRTFETPLGSSRTQIITVKNLSNLNAILKCRTDSEDFIVRDVEYANPGQEIEVKVTHEPTEMSTAIGTLFIESEEAGHFTFPLLGVCVKPLAKGPFLLKPGSSINILFKNVFKKAKDFYMYVDNPAFYLKTSQENILAKTEYNIFVGLQKEKHLEKMAHTHSGKIDPRFPFMGQLVVECFNPYVKWQFYLKGVLG